MTSESKINHWQTNQMLVLREAKYKTREEILLTPQNPRTSRSSLTDSLKREEIIRKEILIQSELT